MIGINPITKTIDLISITICSLDKNPAAVCLTGLSESDRRKQQAALDTIAAMLTGRNADALTCNWDAVRYQHAAAIRTRLAEAYTPATVNKMLSALRRVLKEAWKLGYMTAEDYHRAASVENVSGEELLSGRELSGGEIAALMGICGNDLNPARLLHVPYQRRSFEARATARAENDQA